MLILIFALMLLVTGIVFGVQNTSLISLSFLVWTFEGSLAIVILITFLVGIIIGIICTFYIISKNKRSRL